MNASDETLLGRIASRDQDAFLELYDRFSPRVLGLLRKVVGNPTEAEDVLQDVMWEVWQKAANYDRTLGAPATWVLMLARARGIDHARKRTRYRAKVAGMREATPPDDIAGDPGREMGTDDLRGAMAQLPADRRDVIGLAFFGGLTREQIAEATGVPVGTVKTRIRSGIRQLRDILSERAVTTP